jgi:hypothetical protein
MQFALLIYEAPEAGGFTILGLPSFDAALEWAARCPVAASGAESRDENKSRALWECQACRTLARGRGAGPPQPQQA